MRWSKPNSLALAIFFGLGLFLSGCVSTPLDVAVQIDPARIDRARAEVSEPLWKIPLGPEQIEEMQLLAPNKLLVGLRKCDAGLSNLDYLLIDSRNGAVLWRYRRNRRRGDYHLLLASEKTLLFQVQSPRSSSLVYVNAQTGTKAWSQELNGNPYQVQPMTRSGVVLVLSDVDDETLLYAFVLDSGEKRWERKVPSWEGKSSLVAGEDGVYLQANGIEYFRPESGETLWRRSDLRQAPEAPAQILENSQLLFVDSQNRLLRIDPEKGKTLAKIKLEPNVAVSGISLSRDRFYLLGKNKIQDLLRNKKPYVTTVIDRNSGRTLWSYADALPTVSNLVENKGRIYFGTPTSLVCLNLKTGRPNFKTTITNINRPYPVHLRMFESTIAYIGELNIVGVDSRSGRKRYACGITPFSQEMSLSGVDDSIERLEKKIQRRKKKGPGFSMTTFHASQAAYYQKNSDQLFRAAQTGTSSNPQVDLMLSRMNSEWSKQESLMTALSAIQDIGERMEKAMKAFIDTATLKRLKFIQSSILSAYQVAESQNYVYRPHEKAGMTQLVIVNLPTGRQKAISLSPVYGDYGLWNLVDIDKGIVYHQGIGMDPAGYRYSDSFEDYQGAQVRMYESYLIARPIDLPK